MFYLDKDTYKITTSKGDTGYVEAEFEGDTENAHALISLKDSVDSTIPKWEKRLDIADKRVRIDFSSDDTNFGFGKYVWDLRVIYTNGKIETPMNPAIFEIAEVVGNV